MAGSTDETGYVDGEGADAHFCNPNELAVDSDGSLLVADTVSHCLRRVTQRGTVSTVAGNGEEGFADSVCEAARFTSPWGIDVDGDGTIYVSDLLNDCIRKVMPADEAVLTLCGKNGEAGYADGKGADARFSRPAGLALDTDGNLIIADLRSHCIRKVTVTDGRVTTV